MTQTEKLIAFYGSVLAGIISKDFFIMGWVMLIFAIIFSILYLKDL